MVLQGTAGQCVGHTYILDKPEIVIGSKGPPAGVADIVVTDAEGKISRRHCTVANNGRQFFVMDESTNGTFVNDQPIGKNVWVEIHSGDRIGLAAKAALMLRSR
jgi:predicted component of type VI protein secretion system